MSGTTQVPLSQDRGKRIIMVDEEQFVDIVRPAGMNQPEQTPNNYLIRKYFLNV